MSSRIPELTPDIYDHLRRLAHLIHDEKGRGQQTIQPTVLLHEAWAKVASSSQAYASRAHFVAVAAKAMRQILLDRARDNARIKRGGGRAVYTTLTGVSDDESAVDVVALHEALSDLEALDPNAAQVVLYRIFGGLTAQEIAEVTETSVSTVNRTWRFARAFLADRFDPA